MQFFLLSVLFCSVFAADKIPSYYYHSDPNDISHVKLNVKFPIKIKGKRWQKQFHKKSDQNSPFNAHQSPLCSLHSICVVRQSIFHSFLKRLFCSLSREKKWNVLDWNEDVYTLSLNTISWIFSSMFLFIFDMHEHWAS